MRFILFLVVLVLSVVSSYGQEESSRGDVYFYEYNYEKAIQEYVREKRKSPLTLEQQLKLADSYFKVKDYKNASLYYIIVDKENDSVLSTHRFNKMLQSLAKNGQKKRVITFLDSKSDLISKELLENYTFNKEVLTSKQEGQNFQIKNSKINSDKADFAPAFYKDKVLFTSDRKIKSNRNTQEYLNIFVAKKAMNGELMNPNVFKDIPDFDFHEATPFYAEEVDMHFYIRSNTNGRDMAFDENGKNALAIGVMGKNKKFTYLLKDLSASFYYPFYEKSSDRLYFSGNFEDSYGGADLYYVLTNNGQIMSKPINLGPRINTPANEIAPYIHNGSLYFSSDIFYGFGGMDIYKANFIETGGFSTPINLGSSMNSEQDDFGFIVQGNGNDGLSGYFSSNRKGGKGDDDIYNFKAGKKIGIKTLLLKGKVAANRIGVDKAVVRILDSKGGLIKELYTSEDGDYSMELPWHDQITIKATKVGYSNFSVSYNENQMIDAQKSSLQIEIVALSNLVEEKEGKTLLKLNKFYFDRAKSDVTPLIAAELDKVINTIQSFPKIQIQIESHTASKGSDSTNKKLSQKRADAIKLYLIQKGASVSNILNAIGLGEEKIINNCTNGVYCLDFLHKKNDRTLFVIQNYQELK